MTADDPSDTDPTGQQPTDDAAGTSEPQDDGNSGSAETQSTEAADVETPKPGGMNKGPASAKEKKLLEPVRRAYRRVISRGKLMAVAVVGPDDQTDARFIRLVDDDKQATALTEARKRGLVEQRAGLRLWRALFFLLVSALPIGVLVYGPIVDHGFGDLGGVVYVIGFLEGLWLLSTVVVRAMVRALNVEIAALDYELAVRQYKEEDPRIAADLFFRHQLEVKTYYDQILRQNSQVFWLGIGCVVIGLGVVAGIAAGLLWGGGSSKTLGVQIVTGTLGTVAAALTGFVARVYLTVHNNSAEAIGRFHERLVATNHYHLANLIIATITDLTDKESARADLANSIASPVGAQGSAGSHSPDAAPGSRTAKRRSPRSS
jgi:hypothetical protein